MLLMMKNFSYDIRNHTFIYEDLTLSDLAERALELTIWDHDRLASNEFLGGVRFSLGTGLLNL
jgi:synaptotagmin-like protein